MTAVPTILHEDDDLLVVDKPAGMVCHSAQRSGQTSLTVWLRWRGIATPRLINRLDRETSGVVVVAQNERAAKLLGRQMLRREIQKEYLALCWGQITPARGTIDQPIGLAIAATVYSRREVRPDGQPSVTDYEVVEHLAPFTLVRLWPRTGRTHQLRVHLQWLGHSIVGDKIYGPDERWYVEFIAHGVTPAMLEQLLLPRHALHAAALTLRQPTTQESMTFRAPVPADLARFIEERR